MAELLKFETKLGYRQGRSSIHILGVVISEFGRQTLRKSLHTDDMKLAQERYEMWQEKYRADYRERQRKEVLRASGYDENDGRLSCTFAHAADLYEQQRNARGKQLRPDEAKNLQRWVEAHGEKLMYNITPDIAYQMAVEMFPYASDSGRATGRAGGRKRFGTSLISAVYNSAARVYTGFEKRTWQHEPPTKKVRPRATREWISEFLALADEWQPATAPFQVDHRRYQLDATGWRTMVKACTVFLLTTGTRIAETGHIRWKNVDLENRIITVPGEHRKNGLSHEKMLTPDIADALRVLHSIVPNLPDQFVFPYLGTASACKNFNRRTDDIIAGKLPRLTSHEIGGHGCITLLLEDGLTDREISEITGKSIETIRIYGSATRKVKSERVAGVFAGITANSVPKVSTICPWTDQPNVQM